MTLPVATFLTNRPRTHPNRVNPVPATNAIAAVRAAPLSRGAAAATSASNSGECWLAFACPSSGLLGMSASEVRGEVDGRDMVISKRNGGRGGARSIEATSLLVRPIYAPLTHSLHRRLLIRASDAGARAARVVGGADSLTLSRGYGEVLVVVTSARPGCVSWLHTGPARKMFRGVFPTYGRVSHAPRDARTNSARTSVGRGAYGLPGMGG